jgi:hypothetical protein
MPVTHVARALALTGWCLGPDPLLLNAGVAEAVILDMDEVVSPLGWRLWQLFPNPVLGIGRQRTHSLLWSVVTGMMGWAHRCSA